MTDTTLDSVPASPAPARPISLADPAIKLMLVGALMLVLLVPQWLIGAIISEREERHESVQAEIARSWGQPQSVLGPVLVVPYLQTVPPPPGSLPGTLPTKQRGSLLVLPTRLAADARLAPETRRRGLFEAVVYTSELRMAGSFTLPAIADQPGRELLWREAHLAAGATDLRALTGDAKLTWAGRVLEAAEIGEQAASCHDIELLQWPLGFTGTPEAGRSFAFEATMGLRGTGSFHLRPAAQQTELAMAAPWPTPSFGGGSLPVRSEVGAERFQADWQVGNRLPVLRQNASPCGIAGATAADAVGVALLEAVPTYRMVSRASKYAMMFVALAFLTYVLFELLARVRIHIVQYGLLGCSVVLFPLLLLAFGEPLGFAVAYAISAGAVVVQASAYTVSVTRRAGLASLFAAVLSLLFGFLYGVLSLESYALLAGAVALFAALSVVMVATRRVQWQGGAA